MATLWKRRMTIMRGQQQQQQQQQEGEGEQQEWRRI